MNPDLTGAWLGVGGAALVGALGWVFAGVANSRAKKANKLAEAANGIASDALARADKANTIAEQANKLSEDANSLVSRTVRQQEEDWFVQWEPHWDEERTVLTLVNKGRDSALNLSVVVTGQNIHEVFTGLNDVPKGEKIVVALEEVAEHRNTHARDSAATYESFRNSGIVYVGSSFKAELEIVVRWKTGEGVPGHQEIKLTVR